MNPQEQQVTNQQQQQRPNGDKKVGPIVATLIIVLVLIIASLYIFAAKVNQPAIPTDTMVGAQSQTVQPVTGTSTDVQSLQNDLNKATSGLDNQNF